MFICLIQLPLGTIKHENILPIYSYFTMQSQVCIVQKYAAGGDLQAYQRRFKKKKIPEEKLQPLIKQVIFEKTTQ